MGCLGSGNEKMDEFFKKKTPREEIMSCSHSRKPDLPVTHSSPFSTWLSVLLFFFSLAKNILSGQGYGFVGGGGNIAFATALPP